MDPRIRPVVDAVRRRLEAKAEVNAAYLAYEQELSRWWTDAGVPKAQAASILREALAEAGFTTEQIKEAGVGDVSVKLSLTRPRAT